MAKTWYPVVDYSECVECGTCANKCPHGVYDLSKSPSPIVTYPESCVDHCHKCGNRCPVGAITYVGDDTGWTPPNGRLVEEPCCSFSSCDSKQKRVQIDYLYLDLKTCERCVGTDKVLDEVLEVITPALNLAGFDVVCNKVEIESEKQAYEHRFLSSPTIRINGRDICASVKENSCGCCSDISNADVDCRVFEYNGDFFEVPPKQMLAEAILRSLFRTADENYSCGGFEIPDNIKAFFTGKENKTEFLCESG